MGWRSPRPIYGADTLSAIARLWAQNKTTAEIGYLLDIPKNSICRLARNARLAGDLRFPWRGSNIGDKGRKPKKTTAKIRRERPKTEEAPSVMPSRMPRPAPPRAPIPMLFEIPRGSGEPRRIWELRQHDCRYPTLTRDGGDHGFCGKPQMSGSPYCVEHDILCNPGRNTRMRA